VALSVMCHPLKASDGVGVQVLITDFIIMNFNVISILAVTQYHFQTINLNNRAKQLRVLYKIIK
jgi:hypothetical protein